METEKPFKYYAFISYKREDEEWAKWMQHKLEHYKLPSNLNGRTDLPKEIRPIFKDTSELNPGNLPQQIHDALEQSKFLIVICSPRSAQSEWVNKEVETFIGMGKTDKIIPFIIDGKAFAKKPEEECFPLAIRNLPAEQEILGANIGEMGREAAAVKVVAQMFGLKFDELWQRHEREQKKKRNKVIFGVLLLALISLGVAGWIWHQNIELERSYKTVLENRNRIIAGQANSLINQGDTYLAQVLSLEALETGPYVPELEYPLRYSSLYDKAILKGHTYIVFSVAYSPDARLIASASGDNTVRIWDAKTGACLYVLYGHTYFVESIVFSPDSKYVISGALDNTIRVWDLSDGSCIKVLNVDSSNEGNNLLFLPEGKTFVSWSNEVIFWDFETLECVKKVKCPNLVSAVSPDGKYYASSNGNTWHIHNINTGEEICSLIGHTYWPTRIAFSPDGKLIVTGAGDNIDNTIRIWDSKTGECLYVLKNIDQSIIYSIHFSPDGNRIIASLGGYVRGNKYVVRIWRKENDYWIFSEELEGHDMTVFDAIYSPDMKQIASCSEDQTIRIWDNETIEQFNEKASHRLFNELDDEYFDQVVLSPDSIHIAAIGNNSSYILGGDSIIVLEGHPYITPAFSPDGKTLVSAKNDLIGLWDTETGACIRVLGEHSNTTSVAFSPDGLTAASASSDGTIYLWCVMWSNLLMHTLEQDGEVLSIAFTPDGKKLVSASDNGTIRIWDADSGNCLETLMGHTDAVNFVDVSTDGKYILSASKDHTIRLWNTKTGKCSRFIGKHGGNVWKARFSPNGKRVVSVEAESDGTENIKVWDIESGQCVYKIDEPMWDDGGLRFIEVMFNSKCDMLIGANRYIKTWPIPPLQELIDQTRERFKDRPLTDEERKMYYLE